MFTNDDDSHEHDGECERLPVAAHAGVLDDAGGHDAGLAREVAADHHGGAHLGDDRPEAARHGGQRPMRASESVSSDTRARRRPRSAPEA